MTRPVPRPPLTRPVPVPPRLRVVDRDAVALEAQLQITYWNHPCPTSGCRQWVPNHRRRCADHG